MNVNQLISKLFRRPSNGLAKIPVVSESLERTKKDEWNYCEWLSTGKHRIHLQRIRQAIREKQAGIEPSMEIYLHESNTANGFFFCQRSGFSGECLGYMLEYFKDKVLEQPYYLNNKTRQYEEEPDRIKTTEMYYLKPSLKFQMERPVKQLFGNIHLEFVQFNDKPEYLKVMVTTYNDRNYQEAFSFEEFLDYLLTD